MTPGIPPATSQARTFGTTTMQEDWAQLRAVSKRLFEVLVERGSSPVSAANDVLSVVDDACGGLSL